MGPSGTLIDISAGASIWRHAVAKLRTGTLITARDVHTLVCTQMAEALGTLINVFTGMSVLPEVVALCAVALV